MIPVFELSHYVHFVDGLTRLQFGHGGSIRWMCGQTLFGPPPPPATASTTTTATAEQSQPTPPPNQRAQG